MSRLRKNTREYRYFAFVQFLTHSTEKTQFIILILRNKNEKREIGTETNDNDADDR